MYIKGMNMTVYGGKTENRKNFRQPLYDSVQARSVDIGISVYRHEEVYGRLPLPVEFSLLLSNEFSLVFIILVCLVLSALLIHQLETSPIVSLNVRRKESH